MSNQPFSPNNTSETLSSKELIDERAAVAAAILAGETISDVKAYENDHRTWSQDESEPDTIVVTGDPKSITNESVVISSNPESQDLGNEPFSYIRREGDWLRISREAEEAPAA